MGGKKRMLKNAYLLRSPARSPTRGRGKSRSLFVATPPSSFVVAAYLQVRLTPQDFGSPRERDFAKLNLPLPACRSLGAGRGIFEHPWKNCFL